MRKISRKIEVIFILLFMLFVVVPVAVLAQETKVVEIDVNALLQVAGGIFMTGVGGMSVTALVSLIKRWLNAHGWAVRVISVIVSAGAVIAYLIPMGFIWWKFIVLTTVVALAANGIYLFPQKRTA